MLANLNQTSRTNPSKSPNLPSLRYLRVFATGIIIGVAMLHLLPESAELLRETGSEFINEFPTAPFLMMIGYFLMTSVEEFLPCCPDHNDYSDNSRVEKKLNGSVDADTEMGGMPGGAKVSSGDEATPPNVNTSSAVVHDDGQVPPPTSVLVNIRDVYKVYAMEFSISLHSVVIGFSLGVTDSGTSALVGLTIALCFHQFFEGLAMGLAAYEAKFSKKAFITLVAVYSLSIFIGAVIGINVIKLVSEEEAEKWEGYITGVPNAVAAGMLLHIGQEFLSKDLGVHAPHTSSNFEKVAKLSLLVLGGVIMAFIALTHEHNHDHHGHDEHHDEHDEHDEHDDRDEHDEHEDHEDHDEHF